MKITFWYVISNTGLSRSILYKGDALSLSYKGKKEINTWQWHILFHSTAMAESAIAFYILILLKVVTQVITHLY